MNKNTVSSIRSFTKILVIIGISALVLVGAFSFLKVFAKEKIKDNLESLSGLSYEMLDLRLLLSDIELGGIKYKLQGMEEDTTSLSCASLHLQGISWWKLLTSNELIVNKLKVGDVEGTYSSSAKAQSTRKTQLQRIMIKDVDFDQFNVRYIRPGEWLTEVADLHLSMDGFTYNFADSLPMPQFQQIELSFGEAMWQASKGNYTLSCQSFSGNSQDRNFRISSLKLKPQSSKGQWPKRFNYREPRIDLSIPEIQGKNLNFQRLAKGEGFTLGELSLEQARLEVFIDQRKEKCPDCYKALLHEALLNNPFPIHLPRIFLKQNQIDIEVFGPKSSSPGQVSFNDVYASIYHLSNLPEKIRDTSTVVADIKASFMNEARLEATINFNMVDPNYAYDFQGNLASLNLQTLNQVTRPALNLDIKSGHLSELRFDAEGNNDRATGTLKMDYENLKVKLLEKDDGETKGLLSGLVNLVAVKNKNTQPGSEDYEIGKMYYQRADNSSIFHQWWEAIFSGLKSIVLPDMMLPDKLKSAS